jgi:heptosyltransferase-1
MVSAPVRKVLVVRTSALGDVAHVLPSLEALRRLYPSAEIHWITEPAAAGLLETHPDITRVFVLPRQRWKKDLGSPWRWLGMASEVIGISRRLRRERFDLVIDFHCGLRSSAILLMAGGRRRVGFHPRDAAERGGSILTRIRPPPLPGRLSMVE